MLDTHAVVFDALDSQRLSPAARRAIERGDREGELAVSDITLWEIAMLVARQRLKVPVPAEEFIRTALAARTIAVLPITPAIAITAQSDEFVHGDPADRLIAATALVNDARLVTSDDRLRSVAVLRTIW